MDIAAACWEGVVALTRNYLELSDGDEVAIAYTVDSRDAAAWLKVAAEELGANVALIPMQTIVDPEFEARLERALPLKDCTLKIVTLEANSMSHGPALRRVVSRLADQNALQVDVWRAINAGEEFFAQGVRTKPTELANRNAFLLNRLESVKKVEVTTSGGTNLLVEFDSRFRWINNSGLRRKGNFVILPAGEIATYASSVSGVFVADFAVHVNVFTNFDTRLSTRPVTICLEDSQIVSFSCADTELSRTLDSWFSLSNATQVGEFGLGTNPGVIRSTYANSHVNERVPGVHLGFGQHNQPKNLVDYECDIHIDMIAKGGFISIPGAGRIDLQQLPIGNEECQMDFDVEDVLSLDDVSR